MKGNLVEARRGIINATNIAGDGLLNGSWFVEFYKSGVSVVIPNWNGESTLHAAIAGCLRQTVKPVEILICDDGSKDFSREIVSSFNNPQVHWVPGERSGGPAVPRNRGIRNSIGEWIAFLDSDDEWLPNKLELQLKYSKDMNCLACSSNALRKKNDNLTDSMLISWNGARITFKDLLIENQIVCSSMILHRSIIKKIGTFNENPLLKAFEDYEFWLQAAVWTDIAYIDSPLIIYSDMPELSLRSKGIASEAAIAIIKKTILKQLIIGSVKNKPELKALMILIKHLFSNSKCKKIFISLIKIPIKIARHVSHVRYKL